METKQNYTASLNVRLTPETLSRLRDFSKSKRLRASTVARILISKHLESNKPGEPFYL